MRRQQKRTKRSKFKLYRLLFFLAIAGLLFNYLRPLPHADALVNPLTSAAESVQLQWPAHGSAAIGAQGFGVLATHGEQHPRPTASLAKVITVLAVLEKHPLQPGEQGPVLTLTRNDVALFEKYYAAGGAYVKVEAGEKISLYEALQAILLPSANNMADTLAIWAFGSLESYHAHANAMVKRLGLKQTTVAGDASGLLPVTTSVPADLVLLGERALNNKVIAEIVTQPTATIPVHGVIYSANARLGYTNILGIKTGLTDEAGGCFLFAAKYTADDNKTVTVIGVITGAPTLNAALSGSEPLLASARPYFTLKTPIKAGEVFATLTTPWLSTAKVVARQDITLLAWKGTELTPTITLADINRSLPAGAQVGTAIVASGGNKATAPLVLQQPIRGPDWQWRIKRDSPLTLL